MIHPKSYEVTNMQTCYALDTGPVTRQTPALSGVMALDSFVPIGRGWIPAPARAPIASRWILELWIHSVDFELWTVDPRPCRFVILELGIHSLVDSVQMVSIDKS